MQVKFKGRFVILMFPKFDDSEIQPEYLNDLYKWEDTNLTGTQ